MNEYVIIGIILFALISKRLFKSLGKQISDPTPPIFDQKKKKSVLEEIFGELFDQKEDTNIEKETIEIIQEKKKSSPIASNKAIKDNKIKVEIKEEDEFDLRKAVIYSEILNNPFIHKKI